METGTGDISDNMLTLKIKKTKITLLILILTVTIGCASRQISSLNNKSLDNKTIAVLRLKNLRKMEKYNWLQEAIPDILVTNIAATKEFNIVERSKLDEILNEQQFQSSEFVNDEEIVQLGNLLGAKIIISGSYFVVNTILTITVRVIDVESGKILSATKVDGNLVSDSFFKLTDNLSIKLLKILGSKSKYRKSQFYSYKKTNSLEALEYNYKGKEQFQKGNIEDSSINFLKASLADLNYKEAKQNYFKTEKKYDDIATKIEKQLYRKRKLKEVADYILQQIPEKGFNVGFEEPKILTSVKDPSKINMEITIVVEVSDYLRKLIKRAKKLCNGTTGGYRKIDGVESHIIGNEFSRWVLYQYYTYYHHFLTDDYEINRYFTHNINYLGWELIFMDSKGEFLFDHVIRIGTVECPKLPIYGDVETVGICSGKKRVYVSMHISSQMAKKIHSYKVKFYYNKYFSLPYR